MPSIDTDNPSSSTHSRTRQSQSRRDSSVISVPSYQQSSPTHSRPASSETPLTPEESPPFRSSTKRNAEVLGEDELNSSPSHSREPSGDSAINFCLCQPEPKVPRPRNAFILYRQNHQASIAAHNPGLANPDISKMIGEQWRNESDDEKNRWKAYAEEEKLQHQQRYPLYRYQPKRAGRRTSVSSDTTPFPYSELRKCQRCGGRSIIQPSPSTPSSGKEKGSNSETSPSSALPLSSRLNIFQLPPPTPSSNTTPSTRYLPMLNNLSLNSPLGRRMPQGRPPRPFEQVHQMREQDQEYPPSPDAKRRRFESPQGTYVMSTRPMPPRQNAGPGTPFPFPQGAQQQQHSQLPPKTYAAFQGPGQGRRESLPPPAEILRGRTNLGGPPDMMGPPPRPGPGYSQHRMSQGQMRQPGHELGLTLPPLQTTNVPASQGSGSSKGTASTLSAGSNGARDMERRSVPEIMMSMPFLGKVNILRRIAPPLPQVEGEKQRGTIIAIEGDDAAAAQDLTDWLSEFFSRENEIVVKVIDGPNAPEAATGGEARVQDLLKTIGEWHGKIKEITELVDPERIRKDSAKATPPTEVAERVSGDDQSASLAKPSTMDDSAKEAKCDDAMDVDESTMMQTTQPRVVILFRNYTLSATNAWASRIAIKDAYAPSDHWQWTATLWRGIPGPDMTIYLKDVNAKNVAAQEEFGNGGVEIKKDEKVMAIRRIRSGDCRGNKGGLEGVEAGALRRLGFEIGEWIRGLGSEKGKAAS